MDWCDARTTIKLWAYVSAIAWPIMNTIIQGPVPHWLAHPSDSEYVPLFDTASHGVNSPFRLKQWNFNDLLMMLDISGVLLHYIKKQQPFLMLWIFVPIPNILILTDSLKSWNCQLHNHTKTIERTRSETKLQRSKFTQNRDLNLCQIKLINQD